MDKKKEEVNQMEKWKMWSELSQDEQKRVISIWDEQALLINEEADLSNRLVEIKGAWNRLQEEKREMCTIRG